MCRADPVAVEDYCACGFRLGDGVIPDEGDELGERKWVVHGEVLQHPVCGGRQRRDELFDQGGQPAVVVAGGLKVDPVQQAVVPERRDLL